MTCRVGMIWLEVVRGVLCVLSCYKWWIGAGIRRRMCHFTWVRVNGGRVIERALCMLFWFQGCVADVEDRQYLESWKMERNIWNREYV